MKAGDYVTAISGDCKGKKMQVTKIKGKRVTVIYWDGKEYIRDLYFKSALTEYEEMARQAFEDFFDSEVN